MSIDSTERKQTFVLDGSTVEFNFSFNAIKGKEDNIKAQVIDEDGVVTELEYETDYSVHINLGGEGGTITLEDAGEEDEELLVYRETDNTQESAYEDYNQFPADTVERDFDRRTLKSQELEDDISRAVKASIGSDLTDLDLPLPSAGKALKWNATEDGLVNSEYDVDGILTSASSHATTALGAAAAALVSETNAGLSEVAASNSETNASNSEIAAATSASLALVSEYAAGTYATISQSYSTIAQETVDGKVPYTGATTDLNMGSNGYVGPVTVKQNSDTVAISHDGTDAFMKWSDGELCFMTDEGDNTSSVVHIYGKGTGSAGLRLTDGSNVQYYTLWQQSNGISKLDFGTSVTEYVINEAGADVDFRVEGDTVTDLLKIDAGTDTVSIGGGATSSTKGSLYFSDGTYNRMHILPYSADSLFMFFDSYFDGTNYKSQDAGSNYSIRKSSDDFAIHSAYGTAVGNNISFKSRLIFTSTEAVFNDGGENLDFRVESDTITNALFVDGGTGEVTAGNKILNLGDASTNGSWRFAVVGDDLHVQRREADAWVDKAIIPASE